VDSVRTALRDSEARHERSEEQHRLRDGQFTRIGAIAKVFAREGANVVVHGRDIGALASVRHDIESAGDRVIQVVADVTEFNEIEFARCQIENLFGPVDILVANDGGSFTPVVSEYSVDG
jgi:NADP-dependent 3-hydroxy acid dehydrogenase YdfG